MVIIILIVCTDYNVSGVRVMVFNATFNIISIILWQSDLLVEETGENHHLAGDVNSKLYHIILYRVHLA